MKETTPQVYLIARPQIDKKAIGAYLSEVRGNSWLTRVCSAVGMRDAERLVEFAGRLCYRSWEPGLNPNVTKVRESKEYFENILATAHGSILEHAHFTFVFHNVSRVFTHELVRHRVGVAISQESLRYVRLTGLGFRIPPALEHIRKEVINMVEELEKFQAYATEVCGLDNEGDEWEGKNPKRKDIITFAEKKEITSAMRRLAPLGLSTSIVWTANVRTIRHVLASRTAPGAEEEIRLVFDKVGYIMSDETPMMFADFTRTKEGAWVPSNPVAGQTRV